jgi:PAS domain S-box-containing protein
MELKIKRKRINKSLPLSEKTYRHLFNNLNDAAFLVDIKDGIIIEANPQAEVLLGRSLSEIIGMHHSQIHPPDEATEYKKRFERHVRQGHAADRDGEVLRKDGTRVAVIISASTFTLDGRRLILGLFRDITERREAEEKLKQTEERYRLFAENVNDIIWTVNINDPTRLTYIGPSVTRTLGYSVEEASAARMQDVFTPASFETTMKAIAGKKAMIASGSKDLSLSKMLELELIRKDGSILPVEINCSLIRAADGSPAEILVIARDITQRKQAENALRESEEKLRDLLDNTNDLIFSVTSDGRFRYVNKGWKQSLGYKENEIPNLKISDIVDQEFIEDYESKFARIKTGEEIGLIDTVFRCKNGSKLFVEGKVTCKSVNNELIYSRCIFRDVTRDKHLKEQMFRLSSAISISTDWIVITDFDARIIDVNGRTLELYGTDDKDELVGKHFLELIDPADRLKANMDVKEIMEKGYLSSKEYSLISKDGNRSSVKMNISLVKGANGEPIGMVRIGRLIDKSNFFLSKD